MRKRKKHHKNRPFGLKYKVTTNKGWFKKGYKVWNKNKPRSQETKMKISNSLIGYKLENYHKQNCQCGVCKSKRFEINGKNHPSYINGSSFEIYPVDFYRIRNRILERDNYICQICYLYGNVIHHIDYNKKNNIVDNLITLCNSCHSKTNYNRNYWEKELKKIAI